MGMLPQRTQSYAPQCGEKTGRVRVTWKIRTAFTEEMEPRAVRIFEEEINAGGEPQWYGERFQGLSVSSIRGEHNNSQWPLRITVIGKIVCTWDSQEFSQVLRRVGPIDAADILVSLKRLGITTERPHCTYAGPCAETGRFYATRRTDGTRRRLRGEPL